MAGSVNLFVLNWNGRDLTLGCLSSLEKITYPNVKVYVIDNGSSDNSVTEIQNQFPYYEIIQLPENYGFSRGNNAGFQFVKQKADFTIFWQSSKLPLTSRAVTFSPKVVNCCSWVLLTRPEGYRITTRIPSAL